MTSPWESVQGGDLRQGDWLPAVPIPVYGPELTADTGGEYLDVQFASTDAIVLTQSCDLVVRSGGRPKANLVAVCPVYSLATWTESNPTFSDPKLREKARRGEVEGVHLIASPFAPEDNQLVLVACFRELYSVPFKVVTDHATKQISRRRLLSPYVEHFSQAFARFFMRVGLPTNIPPYK